MPATLTESPLALSFSFPNGTEFKTTLTGLPASHLLEDLARGLCELVHPHGTIASRHTAQIYVVSIRKVVRFLAEEGFTGGAADLEPANLLRFWLSHQDYHERHTRHMLRAFHEHIGQLREDVREHIYGRRRKKKPPSSPYRPYSESEWQRLSDCCQRITDQAWLQHNNIKKEAAESGHPNDVGITIASLAWLYRRHGPVRVQQIVDLIGRKQWGAVGSAKAAANREMLTTARLALFPTQELQLAYRFLLGIHSGIVADGITDLQLDGIDWAGEHVALVQYVKGRTGPEGLSLSAKASRVLLQWIEHSAVLRVTIAAEHRNYLWLAIPNEKCSNKTNYNGVAFKPINGAFAAKHGLHDDGGALLHLHRSRVRTTYLSLLSRRGWTGRTPIDPNHSTAVEGDNYLTVTTPDQQDHVDEIIETGQADLLRKALTPRVFTEQQLADAAGGLLDSVSQLDLPTGAGDSATARELLSGELDVFVASCLDHTSGQWGPSGQPCPARPWVCLLCPLAVFMPRHLPNLLRLKAFFARQFQNMPADNFLKVFGPYAQRLETDILSRFDPHLVDDAASLVTNRDDELPLRPEERTE
jgi:hypothetical protein